MLWTGEVEIDKDNNIVNQSMDTKICPFCAEEIKAAAIVCRYCSRDLPDVSLGMSEPETQRVDADLRAAPDLPEISAPEVESKKSRSGCQVLVVLMIIGVVILAIAVIDSNSKSRPRSSSITSLPTQQVTKVAIPVQMTAASVSLTSESGSAPIIVKTPTPAPTPTLTIEQYKSVSVQHEVREMTRSIEQYIGDTVLYSGDVLQVMKIDVFLSSDIVYQTRFAINGDPDQVILLKDRHKEGDGKKRLLEGDKVEVIGTVSGNAEMKTILGKQVVLPEISVLNIEIIE